ncbi:MAG: hypothetical protein AAFY15_16275 [Cyanobacteria bacterium J06648_11]
MRISKASTLLIVDEMGSTRLKGPFVAGPHTQFITAVDIANDLKDLVTGDAVGVKSK